MMIRKMRSADAEAIHEIHTLCLRRTLLGRYTTEQIEAWIAGRTPQGYLRAAAAGERVFVAENEARVVAFSSWRGDELLALYVHPDFQRQGAGAALFTACVEDAERFGAGLDRVKSALGAEGFYARRGYAVVGPDFVVKRETPIPYLLMRRA